MSETGWLIERRRDGETKWIMANGMGFEWTSDSLKSIRFCRREDAEQIAAILDHDADAITCHEWVDAEAVVKTENDAERLSAAVDRYRNKSQYKYEQDGFTCRELSSDAELLADAYIKSIQFRPIVLHMSVADAVAVQAVLRDCAAHRWTHCDSGIESCKQVQERIREQVVSFRLKQVAK